MIQAKLNNIRDYILTKNTYFQNGYSDVIQDVKGIIRNGQQIVFPDDKKGNYFYLRQPDKFDITASTMAKISDCRGGVAYKGDITLVAYLTNADANTVISNLVVTLLGISEVYLKSAIVQPERVVLNELSKSSDDVKKKGMANIHSKMTLVSVIFTVEEDILSKCITDPCKC